MPEMYQEILAKWATGLTSATGYVTAPGSGATITMFDSGSSAANTIIGSRYKRIVWNGVSSADSGANGLSFEETFDDGANWDVVIQYTNTATVVYQRFVAIAAPRWRVRYTNSASVLTTWRGALLGDCFERATQ